MGNITRKKVAIASWYIGGISLCVLSVIGGIVNEPLFTGVGILLFGVFWVIAMAIMPMGEE
jgi:hypothetical protein